MRQIVDIFFPAQYTFSAQRSAEYRNAKATLFAEERFLTEYERTNSLFGEDVFTLIFGKISIADEEDIRLLFIGNCVLIREESELFAIRSVSKTENSNELTLFCEYREPYEPKEFQRLVANGAGLVAGDDNLGIEQ